MPSRRIEFSFPGAMIGALCVGVIAFAAVAQGARSTIDGVYTAAQAARGKALYFDNCVTCHGDQMQGVEDTPGFAGEEFSRRWGSKSVGELYRFVDTQMPSGRPGALGASAEADVIAYILAFNLQPPGKAELSADPKALDAITIAAPPPATSDGRPTSVDGQGTAAGEPLGASTGRGNT